MKYRVGLYDYLASTISAESGFYNKWNTPHLKEAFIFKDWETPNTWIGTVMLNYLERTFYLL